MQLSRNLKLRETIHRAGALEPLMKILSANSEDDAALQRVRKCSIELLWNIMLNVARDNNSKHLERMDGLSRCVRERLSVHSTIAAHAFPILRALAAPPCDPSIYRNFLQLFGV